MSHEGAGFFREFLGRKRLMGLSVHHFRESRGDLK